MERICRSCLRKDMAEEEKSALREAIKSIPQSERTDSGLAERRLAVCFWCKEKSAGTCLSCGCFVEYMSACAGTTCPLGLWPGEPHSSAAR